MRPPIVGITCDLIVHNGIERAAAGSAYARAVAQAGGLPILLPPIPGSEAGVLQSIDAFVLTGGDDPLTEPFGVPTHPAACRVHPDRQAFEVELLRTAPDNLPVLGVCLGMQYMALVAGGALDQHLPETMPTHADHAAADHAIKPVPGSPLPAGTVSSKHHQAVSDAGSLDTLAHAHDGVIEAIGRIDTDNAIWKLGVQWHPERTRDAALGQDLFQQLIDAARRRLI